MPVWTGVRFRPPFGSRATDRSDRNIPGGRLRRPPTVLARGVTPGRRSRIACGVSRSSPRMDRPNAVTIVYVTTFRAQSSIIIVPPVIDSTSLTRGTTLNSTRSGRLAVIRSSVSGWTSRIEVMWPS